MKLKTEKKIETFYVEAKSKKVSNVKIAKEIIAKMEVYGNKGKLSLNEVLPRLNKKICKNYFETVIDTIGYRHGDTSELITTFVDDNKLEDLFY